MKHQVITRSVPLLDLEVVGRTVTAYAATFGEPYEVNDQYGHYDEMINRAGFNMAAGRGFPGAQPIFNHGLTIYGTPSEKWSVSLGVPESIKPDGRGLLTVTRYNKLPAADEALEMINSGSVKYQSFRGPVHRSAPPRSGPNGRPLIERMVLGLRDYGPAIFAVNMKAEIMAVRSQMLAESFGDLDPDERRELIALWQKDLPAGDTPPALDLPPGTDAPTSAPSDEPGSSLQLLELANAQRRRH